MQETISDENNWFNIFIKLLVKIFLLWVEMCIFEFPFLFFHLTMKKASICDKFEIKKRLNLFRLVTNNEKASTLSFKLH